MLRRLSPHWRQQRRIKGTARAATSPPPPPPVAGYVDMWEGDSSIFTNGALNYDGGVEITSSNSLDLRNTDFSQAGWLNYPSGYDTEQPVFSQGLDNGLCISGIYHSAAQQFELDVYFDGVQQASASVSFAGFTNVTAGWLYYGVHFTHATKTLHIRLTTTVTSYTLATSPQNAGVFYFGFDGTTLADNGNYIDSMGIWTNDLQGGSVPNDLFNGGQGRTFAQLLSADTVGLVSWYDFSEATFLNDSGPAANTLTNPGNSICYDGVTLSKSGTGDYSLWYGINGGLLMEVGGQVIQRPQYAPSLCNGYGGVQTPGGVGSAGQGLQYTITPSNTWTVFLVAQHTGSDTTDKLFQFTTNDFLEVNGGQYKWVKNSGGATVNCGGTPGNWNVITLSFTSGNLKVRINGTQTATLTPNTTYASANSMTLFTDSGAESSFNVVQFGVYGAMTLANIEQEEADLGAKFGITV